MTDKLVSAVNIGTTRCTLCGTTYTWQEIPLIDFDPRHRHCCHECIKSMNKMKEEGMKMPERRHHMQLTIDQLTAENTRLKALLDAQTSALRHMTRLVELIQDMPPDPKQLDKGDIEDD